MKKRNEFCNECGKRVSVGSGRFVNRVIDCNTIKDRKDMGKPYPKGDFICEQCDLKIREGVL